MKEVAPGKNLVTPQLIVGLGNPEPKYDQTRHNIGFAAIDYMANLWQISLSVNRKFKGEIGEGKSTKNEKVYLLKPSTYMNKSGEAIRGMVDWYKLPHSSVLIIYDDMDLAVGRLRLRLSGSAGGHNGMKSAIAHLGTQEFPRLRIGIGKPKNVSAESGDPKTISHVLGKFSSTESKLMTQMLDLVVETVEVSLKQGVAKAMSLYNNRTITLSED
ncbi:aminoacyl-tRNA hydrolase [Okeania sp.]|uniref:aminoacyl-tRNA hydrolase n=1 Tax=Okeania sp. TaxID=3100323 RepID=UPI002B4AE220|nr:aminoacyl-tRNA hydrolase [Okeania sp.]MEB3342404.1 aminoacyl-tRNA hydrolase [Okeania sp.]